MLDCRYCGEYIHDDPEKVGARCPRCREPLYERAGGPRLASEVPPDDDRGLCAAHPENVAVGTCQRCGNFICRVCRTRWEGLSVCPLCLDRALHSEEATPEQVRAHRRQASLSLWGGIAAWALVAGALLMMLAATASAGRRGGDADGSAILGGMLLLSSFAPSAFGVGLGASAILARGDRMVLATLGLVLSGAHLGILAGMLLLAAWRQ
jgi:hypothetical protein